MAMSLCRLPAATDAPMLCDPPTTVLAAASTRSISQPFNTETIPGAGEIVDYALWNGCGVEPVGFCSSGVIVQVSFLLASVMVLLAALLV